MLTFSFVPSMQGLQVALSLRARLTNLKPNKLIQAQSFIWEIILHENEVKLTKLLRGKAGLICSSQNRCPGTSGSDTILFVCSREMWRVAPFPLERSKTAESSLLPGCKLKQKLSTDMVEKAILTGWKSTPMSRHLIELRWAKIFRNFTLNYLSDFVIFD